MAKTIRALGFYGVYLFVGTIAAAEPQAGTFPKEVIRVGSDTREYRLVVPATVNLANPAPLVVAFPGSVIDSKDLMPLYTELNTTAEKHKFIVAYPNPLGRSWALSVQKAVADLAFFDALVLKVSSSYQIDSQRIYVVGMSNGGYFAHIVGKERSQTVAAAACHSGALGLQTLPGINAERKFPVLIAHGDQDRIIPVGVARQNRDKYLAEGHAVKYVELEGVGHMWGTKFDINETLWQFFADHPLPGAGTKRKRP
ncbi:MAG: PHB depolymerase family esterase [Planctomycetaceae bacterium]|nr:PHB depolymerase family esterase [Planctomycetaceae bacterium]